MNKTILGLIALLSIFIIGCQPAAQPAAPAAPAEPAPVAAPAETLPAEGEGVPEAAETGPAPVENVAAPINEELNIEQACYGLLSAEDFESICGYTGKVDLTPKISEGGCWVNIADQKNNKLTAGFTVVDWDKEVEANEEFDRGVRARVRQGAVEQALVGTRNYQYDEVGRHNIVWATGQYLTRLGAMTDLCPADKLVAVGQKIDAGLRQ
jgi:hypothetical protein